MANLLMMVEFDGKSINEGGIRVGFPPRSSNFPARPARRHSEQHHLK